MNVTNVTSEENRIEENRIDNIDIYTKYGEFQNIKLTQEQYDKLIIKFGEKNTPILIEELSTGIASKGYKYKKSLCNSNKLGKKKDRNLSD